jgi:multidrug efflux pump subunit AcrA (membrane-fusion protein)
MRFWLSCLLLLVFSCGEKKENKAVLSPNETVVPVRTQILRKEAIIQPIEVSGVVASQTEVKLAFKTGGIIEQYVGNRGTGSAGKNFAPKG